MFLPIPEIVATPLIKAPNAFAASQLSALILSVNHTGEITGN
jgi:hypothetical protein